MSCLQKASFQNLVESNKEESLVRLNCDWEVSKIVVCQQIIGYSRKSFLQFTGHDSEIQLYNYVKELISEGSKVTIVLEIGRCGFESSRLIQSLGADVHIVPMNKLAISNKSKRAKSDRLDAEFLSRLDLEETPRVWIPSSKQSSRRKLLECRENKQKEINRINLRLQSFIAYAPFRLSSLDKKMPSSQWRETFNTWKQQVPDLFDLVIWEEMFDLLDRLELAEKSYRQTMDRIETQEKIDRQKCQEENIEHIVDKIRKIKGFGVHSSRVFSWYIGDFTRFSNGKNSVAT